MAFIRFVLGNMQRSRGPQVINWPQPSACISRILSSSGPYHPSTPPKTPPASFYSSAPSPPRLHDKVAVVTGASSGMGRAFALAFAAEGAHLVVCADLQAHAREIEVPTHELICQRYGQGKARFVKTDVGVAGDVEDCVGEAISWGSRLDVMVNNAGIGFENKLVHEMEEETWDAMMKVNLRGVFLGCKNACTQFLKQGKDDRGHAGWIINMASVAGLTGYAGGTAAYCASKAGVVNFTKAVALDYAKHGVHCNALCPGYIKTPMTKGMYEDREWNAKMVADTPWGTLGDPADVAKAAVFLASADAAWITGIALSVDGGLAAH